MNGKLRNIGPKSAAWLRQVGIHEPEQLIELGAVEAFVRIRRAGFRPSLNLLYALEGALLGVHWQAADAATAELPLPPRQAEAKRIAPVTYIAGEDIEESD